MSADSVSGTKQRTGDGADDKAEASPVLTELPVCRGDQKEERAWQSTQDL